MKKGLISVIMPVYNGVRYLEEAIASILRQTYKDFEFIIINDGSTDDSLKIVRSFLERDSRIIVISRENRGLTASLNEGIEAAEGDFIARMDADDYSYPDRFAKEIELFRQRPELYLVGTNFTTCFEDSVSEETRKMKLRFEKNVNEPVSEQNWRSDILEDYKILHPTWMVKKELFDRIGLYKEYCTEDVEFLFRTVCNGYAVGKVHEPLLKYRVSEESKSVQESRLLKAKEEICSYKLEYVRSQLGNRLAAARYLVWGADISGEIVIRQIKKSYPNAECCGIIDSFKTGRIKDIPIIQPQDIKQIEHQYVFIATNGGRKAAIQSMRNLNKQELWDYFKVV